MFIVHVHCSLFMFIVHCSHGATLIFDDLFKAKPCILLCLTWAIARTLYLINVYHCLGGLLHSTLYCTFETILELFYWRRHILGHILAPGTCVLLSLEQRWERTCVSVCLTHCVDKASFRFHRKASRKV